MSRMNKIRNHFEEEAIEFDSIIKNLIPYYNQMVEAVVNALLSSFPEHSECIEVLDLGCGTGTISRAIKDMYPKAHITCLDISDNMLQMARLKLSDDSKTTYINKDFYNFDFDKKYDAVVSSLALHHLVSDEDKFEFYKKIFKGIKSGGIFVNADVVLASDDSLQNRYMEKWKEFMYKNIPAAEVDNKWIPAHYEEDRPISLMNHFDMLRQAGFTTIDVVWKYYNFAVYMGNV